MKRRTLIAASTIARAFSLEPLIMSPTTDPASGEISELSNEQLVKPPKNSRLVGCFCHGNRGFAG